MSVLSQLETWEMGIGRHFCSLSLIYFNFCAGQFAFTCAASLPHMLSTGRRGFGAGNHMLQEQENRG